MVALKEWRHAADPLLADICRRLLDRHLPAIRFSNSPFPEQQVQLLRQQAISALGLNNEEEASFYVGTGTLRNHAYQFNDQEIYVLYKDDRCTEISQASDQLDRHFLEKQVTKYYLYYPKELRSNTSFLTD